MRTFRYWMMLASASWVLPLAGQDTVSGYVGRSVCRGCHQSQFQSHSKTGHSNALRRAQTADPGPGKRAQWAFGAGAKAITWVSQTSDDTIAEHGLTYYSANKTLALTPGHKTPDDLVYRTFDPVATALLCFRCHSTGPIKLASGFQVQPTEPGVHCESCHGPGQAHAGSAQAAEIQNPKKLSSVQINVLCGSCHRQASSIDDDRDWSNAWNVRHQPLYLERAACFRNSEGALSCLTCHEAHQPLRKASASYDGRCVSCHPKTSHKTPVASRGCVNCHMPQVAPSASLKFTNHWIGIYSPVGRKLIPTKRSVKELRPLSVSQKSTGGVTLPADPTTLIPVYAAAVAERERQAGPNHSSVARAASDLGAFLLQMGSGKEAEKAFQRAIAIDTANEDIAIAESREGLARALKATGKHEEAREAFRLAAQGKDPAVSARSLGELAENDPERAVTYLRDAIAFEEKASGTESARVALLLHQYSLALRAKGSDQEAEPFLRRALAIQRATTGADPRVTIGVLNTLGNVLQGRGQLDEAEKLIRSALALSEERFGPESPQLAMSCTYLADVLWSKKDLRQAGLLYRRAIAIDVALYGPDQPQTAADIANLGMLMNAAGQSGAGEALLRQALAIYEKTIGPDSNEAKLVREQLVRSGQ